MIETWLDLEQKVVYQKATGEITWTDILQAMATALADENYAQCDKSCWNFTEAKAQLSLHEIDSDIDSLHRNVVAQSHKKKMAWITASELGKSVVELYLNNYDWADDWQVFTDLEIAKAWLLAD